MASPTGTFPCNTCLITFTASASQRSHMRSQWHVSNLHHRIAGEATLSEEEYNKTLSKLQKPLRRSPSIELEGASTGGEEETEEQGKIPPATQCLFCLTSSPSISENVLHMSSTHGLFIPNANRTTDMESFLVYLGTLVFKYHECLYCGRAKGSLGAIRTHMRDKGHGMVRMEDVTAFWDEEDEEPEEQNTKEWKLPSGAIITSKSNRTSFKLRSTSSRTRHRGKEEGAIAFPHDESCEIPIASAPEAQLTLRNANLSLAGVPASDMRALQRCEKRNKTRQALAEKENRRAMEQAPVLTKYYKTENPVYQAG
jgi:pre-60S factor REI1